MSATGWHSSHSSGDVQHSSILDRLQSRPDQIAVDEELR